MRRLSYASIGRRRRKIAGDILIPVIENTFYSTKSFHRGKFWSLMAGQSQNLPLCGLPPGMHEYVIHFAQAHETFRKPELESLATLHGITIDILHYSKYSPFARVALKSNNDAAKLISRAILIKGIYELWASGHTYDEVHSDLRQKTAHTWHLYKTCSFRFDFQCFQAVRKAEEQRRIIESFSYLGFEGPIRMRNPDELFTIMEDYEARSMDPEELTKLHLEDVVETPTSNPTHLQEPHQIFVGRQVGIGNRAAREKFDLKKRNYIGTTSMDAELSLITANIALAAPGTLIYDPFVGTGSFLIACAHYGALTFGSDIDGRMIRGNKPGKDLKSNYGQYRMDSAYGDMFISDLTNSPLGRVGGNTADRSDQVFDAIICDPPYGVREGLKVLGSRDITRPKAPIMKDGIAQHLLSDYIPPKRPYSFEAMLNDIMNFASTHLAPGGRLCIWLPTANEDLSELAVPTHRNLKLESVSVQQFNKWSRRLLAYSRVQENESKASVQGNVVDIESIVEILGKTADSLNPFRRKYFEGFKAQPS